MVPMNPETAKAMNLALGYLSRRAKTIFEMNAYLKKKEFETRVITQVINLLIAEKYLDDRAFAKQFIENRIQYKPKSKFALAYELKHKGVDSALSEKLLYSYDDQELAFKAVGPKIKAWKHLDKETRQKKLMNYLNYRGFNYEICKTAWEQFKNKF